MYRGAGHRRVEEARHLGFDVVIVDSAGRPHIDDELMTELARRTKAAQVTPKAAGSARLQHPR